MNTTVIVLIASLFSPICIDTEYGLQGEVIHAQSGAEILYAKVGLYLNEILIQETNTDAEGIFGFENLRQGFYTLEVESLGYEQRRITNIRIGESQITRMQISMHEEKLTDGLVDKAVDLGAQGLAKLIKGLLKKKDK